MGRSKKQQKIIDQLEKNCAMTRQFMEDWLRFNQILSTYPKPGVNKAELENEFLKIKSKLAREHKALRDSLGADYALDGNTMNIVSGATNLESIYSQSDVSVKKLQNEWHRAFIAVNETLGGLEDKKARAERGEKVFIGVPGVDMPAGGVSSGGGMSPTMKRNVMIVVVLLIIVAVVAFVPPVRDLYLNAIQDLF